MMQQYTPGDPQMIDTIVGELKSKGIFDQFRRDCIADVDTKPAYQNLHQRVEATVNGFLAKKKWQRDLNKNQLRESLRKHIHESGFLDIGIERIVDQVVNPKIMTVFVLQVEDIVYKFLGLEKPNIGQDITNGSAEQSAEMPKTNTDPSEAVSAVSSSYHEQQHRQNFQEQERVNNESIPPLVENTENNHHTFVQEEKPQLKMEFNPPPPPPPPLIDESELDDSLLKVEDDEEEDSPPFEPIINEENSIESHFSSISELTNQENVPASYLSPQKYFKNNIKPACEDEKYEKINNLTMNDDSSKSSSDNLEINLPLHEEKKKEVCDDEKEKETDEPDNNCIETETNNKSKVTKEDKKDEKRKEEKDSSKKSDRRKDDKEKDRKKEVKRKTSSSSSSTSGNKDKYSRSDSKSKNKDKDKERDKNKDKEQEKDKLKEKSKDKDYDKYRSKDKERHNKEYKSREKRHSESSSSKEDRKQRDDKNSDKVKTKEEKEREDKNKTKDEKDREDKEEKKQRDDKLKLKEDKEREDKIKTKDDKDREDKEEKKQREDKIKTKEDKDREDKEEKKQREDKLKPKDDKEREDKEERTKREEKFLEKINTKEESEKDKEKKTTSDKSKTKSSTSNKKEAEKRRESSNKLKKDEKEEKKKRYSKKDDHRPHRNKREDRRSADRDSNGRNRSSSTTSRSQAEGSSSSSTKSSGNSSSNPSESSDKPTSSGSNKPQDAAEGGSGGGVASRVHGSPSSNLPLKKRPLTQGVIAEEKPENIVKIKKPKIASNIFEIRKIMKLRKSIARMERQKKKKLSRVQEEEDVLYFEQVDYPYQNFIDYVHKLDDSDNLSDISMDSVSSSELSVFDDRIQVDFDITNINLQEFQDSGGVYYRDPEGGLVCSTPADEERENKKTEQKTFVDSDDSKNSEMLPPDRKNNKRKTRTSYNFCKRKSPDIDKDNNNKGEVSPAKPETLPQTPILRSTVALRTRGSGITPQVPRGAVRRVGLGRPKRNGMSTNSTSGTPLAAAETSHEDGAGSDFVMPLSPDSDVSASSGDQKKPLEEKATNSLEYESPENNKGNKLETKKNIRNGPSNNQRYTSDDLYKPRPLFSLGTTRRSRSRIAALQQGKK